MGNLIDWLFPLECIYCGKNDILAVKIGICRKCYTKNSLDESNRCKVCKSLLVIDTETSNTTKCTYCSEKNIFFEKLYYIRFRDEQQSEIIRKIKFGNSPCLALYFRLGLNPLIKKIKKYMIHYIIHVPSSKKTTKNRPYFSSKPVIDSLVKKTGAEMISPLEKISSELQSDKTYFDRYLHANKAFRITRKYAGKLSGNILVVDDVFTTGASTNEIAKILLANGAEKVLILVMVKNRELTGNLEK